MGVYRNGSTSPDRIRSGLNHTKKVMLEVNDIHYRFGRVHVLRGVGFSVQSGEIVGLLGPNGAGKTTTMRVLTGYLSPQRGDVRFDGVDIRKDVVGVRAKLGYLPENNPLYTELTVREHLGWAAQVKRSANPGKQSAEVMERCGLSGVAGKLVGHLSKGYRQRVGLAQAILGQTKLLILDEPTVGLDPTQIREIRELIRELGRERTILLSTHILPEVELVCGRVLVMAGGKIVAEDTPAGLKDAVGKGKYLLRLGLDAQRLAAFAADLVKLPYIAQAEAAEAKFGLGAVVLGVQGGLDKRAELARFVVESGTALLEFKPAEATLEEAFVSLTAPEAAQSTSEAEAA